MKKNKILFILIIFFLFILSQYPIQADNDYTKLYIKPENKQVSPGETFNITIYCEPTEPIKSYEFDVDFDPTILNANSISKGDIFNNSETWFNAGTIDNSIGYIDNIYCLITENKTVTNSGSFAIISFTANEINSTTILKLNDTGITNESSYINYILDDGTIIVGSGNNNPPNNPPSNPPGPSNQPPSNPNKPSGINFGFANITYNFTTSTSDPDNDQIEYLFDWDDNSEEIWIGSYISNEVISNSHLWQKPGIYEIKVKAKDIHGSQSDWSSPLTVAIEEQETNQTQNNKPKADFSYTPNKPTYQDNIQFTDLSIDTDGVITKWLWNFGDDSTSELQNPTHQYQINNSYIITLTVWDNNNSIDISQKTIIIEKTNDNKQSETPGFSLIIMIFALTIIIFYINKKLL